MEPNSQERLLESTQECEMMDREKGPMMRMVGPEARVVSAFGARMDFVFIESSIFWGSKYPGGALEALMELRLGEGVY
uniref:Uncharacterized protein n=1 Tax=Lutzomyia longipalpis TaxID=7200 RepID=A0A1B0CBZ7_LUTLO